jgi:hypothetical protein
VNAVYNPLGCYDVRRFQYDQHAMINEVMTVFDLSRKTYVYSRTPAQTTGKTYTIQTAQGPWTDLVRESPVDRFQIRARRRVVAGAALAVAACAAAAAIRLLGGRRF